MVITVITVIALFGLGATAVRAQLAVYHSAADDGIDTGNTVPGDVSPHPLYLYITKGLATSTSGVCESGTGDEICGYTIDLATQGQFSFIDFTPEPGSDLIFNLSANRFRATALDHLNPSPGPKRIGTLNISTAGVGGGVNMANSQAVSADLVLEGIPDGVIAVPEPPLTLGLLTALTFLTWMDRRRRC